MVELYKGWLKYSFRTLISYMKLVDVSEDSWLGVLCSSIVGINNIIVNILYRFTFICFLVAAPTCNLCTVYGSEHYTLTNLFIRSILSAITNVLHLLQVALSWILYSFHFTSGTRLDMSYFSIAVPFCGRYQSLSELILHNFWISSQLSMLYCIETNLKLPFVNRAFRYSRIKRSSVWSRDFIDVSNSFLYHLSAVSAGWTISYSVPTSEHNIMCIENSKLVIVFRIKRVC